MTSTYSNMADGCTACVGFTVVSMVGSGVIAIVYAQRGGASYGPVY